MTGDVDDLDGQMSAPVSDVETADQLESDEIKDRQFVAAIARGFDILHAFRAEDPMLGNQELAERTGLPRATVSRLTHTLTRLGYLSYLPRFAKYQLGLGAVPLGQLALANMSIRRVAAPLMRALSEETKASTSLGKRDGLAMLYVEPVAPRTAVALQLDIGSRLPLALTAMGRAYCARCRGAGARSDRPARSPRASPPSGRAIRDGLREAVSDAGAAWLHRLRSATGTRRCTRPAPPCRARWARSWR